MTTAVLAPTDDLVAALRGTAALRPDVDRGLAGGLRAWLEDGLFERLGDVGPAPVVVTSRSVADLPTSERSSARLRGALVASLLRLHVAGCPLEDPYAAAVAATCASGRDGDLAVALAELDADEAARLAAEVAAHHAVLSERLGSLPARWSPRCGARLAIPLAGGAVVLRGTVDLALGAPGGSRACVCLLDVTTSRHVDGTATALSYLALLETLRAGEPPLRVASLSTATGEARVCDVTPVLLAGAVEAVLGSLAGTRCS